MKPVCFRRLAGAFLAASVLLLSVAQAAPVPNLTDLHVYAKLGFATTETNPTSNPFTSTHLAKKAIATGAFALRWSRKEPNIRPLKGISYSFRGTLRNNGSLPPTKNCPDQRW